MVLYIKQKVFSWRDRFYVRDAHGNDRYYVEGEIFTWGKKLHIYDMAGNEVCFISQRLFTWMPKYEIFMGGELVATVKKEFTFIKPRYTVFGPDWQIFGSFWEHDYQITCGEATVAVIRKEWFTWGDSYMLDIEEGYSDVLTLSIMIVIDCVMAAQAAAAAST